MQITLTHRILHAASMRPPGMPVSECLGQLDKLPTPKGVQDTFELYECRACGHRIPTDRVAANAPKTILNDYDPAPDARETAQATR